MLAQRALEGEIAHMGGVVMLAFGGGSIKRSGLYDRIRALLDKAGKTVVDFGGIMPNPRMQRRRKARPSHAKTA